MARRTIKKSLEGEMADILILRLLFREGEKKFGEISEYLKNKGISYSKEGLLYLLRNLLKKHQIRKHRISSKAIPYYYVSNRNLIDLEEISLGANSFQLDTGDWRTKLPHDFNSNFQLETTIKDWIYRIGLYTIFTHIHSWKLTSKNQSVEKNYNIRKAWLEQSLLRPLISDVQIEPLLARMHPFLMHYDLVHQTRETTKKLLQLEKIISEIYPEDVRILNDAIANLPPRARDSRF